MLEKTRKRHLRLSLQMLLTLIIPICGFIAIGTEDTFLCVSSAFIMISSLIIMNRYGD